MRTSKEARYERERPLSARERIGRVGADLEWAFDQAIDAAVAEDLTLGDLLKELSALWEERKDA